MQLHRFKWYAAAPLLAATFIVNAATIYSDDVPLPLAQIARDCAIVIGLVAAIAMGLMIVRGDDRTKGAALSFGVLLSGAYPPLAFAVGVAPCSLRDAALGTAFLIAIAAAFWRIAQRQQQVLASSHSLIAAIAVLTVAYEGYTVASRWARPDPELTLKHPGGMPIALPAGPRPPDIIHIVFDGLGRLDVLDQAYGLSSESIHLTLADHGMSVSDRAVANYSQTFPALAAVLSMEYLDDPGIAAAGIHDRTIAQTIIRHSTVIKALKARGYAFTLLSSGYEALLDHPDADDGLFGPTLFGEFESFLVPRTMLRALPIASLTYEPQRRRTRAVLDALHSFRPTDRPRFMLAHVFLPHPPFRYTADGRYIAPRGVFTIRDGEVFPGTQDEYRRGYAAQARFVFQELQKLLAGWKRLSPPPIVIAHGDHGSGLGYNLAKPKTSNVQGRLRIFLGVQAPISIGPINSPVNIYRQVFRSAFGVQLAPLPDRSFVSAWRSPYDFDEVVVR